MDLAVNGEEEGERKPEALPLTAATINDMALSFIFYCQWKVVGETEVKGRFGLRLW